MSCATPRGKASTRARSAKIHSPSSPSGEKVELGKSQAGRRDYFLAGVCHGGGFARDEHARGQAGGGPLAKNADSMGRCDALGAGLTAFVLVGGVVSFSPPSLPISSASGKSLAACVTCVALLMLLS